MAWTAVAGAAAASVAGGLLANGTSSGGTQTQTSEPWAPAKPWLENQITTGQNLQNYYQSHPFNALQQQGYQNLYANLDNYNSNVAPALQAVANRLMNSNYSRTIGQSNYQQPPIAGYGQPQPMRPGVNQMSQQQAPQGYGGQSQGYPAQQQVPQGYPMQQQQQAPNGLIGPAVQRQFYQPQMDMTQGYRPYGLLDWASAAPDVNKLNADAEAAANAKKPKTQDAKPVNNQVTDNSGGGGM